MDCNGKVGQKVPLLDWVHANDWGEINDPFPTGEGQEMVLTLTKGDNIFALKVHNDCMEPEFSENDIIIVNPDEKPRNNDFVVAVNRHKNEATFKQYRVSGSVHVLRPLNSKYDDIVIENHQGIEIIGVVVEKIRRYGIRKR
jgi:SOS-response transcriptional repressor LexA